MAKVQKGSNPFVIARQVHHKYGGEAITMSGALTLTRQDAQVLTLDPGGAARTVTLPKEEGNEGMYFEIRNAGEAGEDLTINNDAASAVVVIPGGGWAKVQVSAASAWQIAGQGVGPSASGVQALPFTSRPQGYNGLSPRFELKWIAGAEGLPDLNATAASDLIDPRFEILGTNASADDVTYYAEGGIKLETDGADGDEVIVLPHLDAGQSVWTEVTWGTDKSVVWEAHIKTGSNITNAIIWAGLKLTNTEVKATDDDQVYFRYEDDVASGNWEVVDSIGGTDTSTDTSVAGAVDTEIYLKIIIGSDRVAKCYLNNTLVRTTSALTDATDFIPYIGVAADGAAAAKHIYVFGQAISRVIG